MTNIVLGLFVFYNPFPRSQEDLKAACTAAVSVSCHIALSCRKVEFSLSVVNGSLTLDSSLIFASFPKK